jgi:hypothetical protein
MFAKNAGLYSMSDGIHNNKRLLERGASLPSTPPSASDPTEKCECWAAPFLRVMADGAAVLSDRDDAERLWPETRTALREIASTIESQASELVRLRGLESRAQRLRVTCQALPFPEDETDGLLDALNLILDGEGERAILSEKI